MPTRRAALGALLATPALRPALAQEAGDFPNRPVRVVLPYAAGGQADTIARIMQPRMSEFLGQPVVIENRSGAGGSIGAGVVAGAVPDGYTMLFDAAAFLIVPLAVRGLTFDYETAFAPVGVVAEQPYVLGVAPELGVADLPALIAKLRGAREPLPYGTPGIGSIGHLAGALLAKRANIPLEHVAYRGGADVSRDMMAGTLQAGILSYNSLAPVLHNNKARAIAVTSGIRRGDRSIPTIAEAGFPGFDVTSWTGVFTRAGTPPAVIRKLAAACNHATIDPTVRERMATIGSDAAEADPDSFGPRLTAEREVVKSIVREANIVFQ
ncbi:Bug family tripartite tricarboxylate transporter substrate binding protein [Roseococcus sp. YIM B11640]|uniref:Bug family tripartite tricarboxylate transporter substrate binding protein n=1 Tax=Roseococcus sp. YIM B11640 TaxID=3133973 RepID=UPI003C7A5CC2